LTWEGIQNILFILSPFLDEKGGESNEMFTPFLDDLLTNFEKKENDKEKTKTRFTNSSKE
jgi:hypothetical protein